MIFVPVKSSPTTKSRRQFDSFIQQDLIDDLRCRLDNVQRYLESEPDSSSPFWQVSPPDPHIQTLLDLKQPKTEQDLDKLADAIKTERPQLDPDWVDKIVRELGNEKTKGDQAVWLAKTIQSCWTNPLQHLEGLNESLKPLLTCSTSIKSINEQWTSLDAQRNHVIKNEELLRHIAAMCKDLEHAKRICVRDLVPSTEQTAAIKSRIQSLNQQTLNLMERVEKFDQNLMDTVQRIAESNAIFTALVIHKQEKE